MKKVILILLPILLISKTITPKLIKVHDRYRYRRGNPNGVGISSIEASFQATSIGFLATSSIEYDRQHRYSQKEIFLEENRAQIEKEISYGKGEYLSTFLELIEIKPSKKAILKLQNNLPTLSKLENREFLEYCTKIFKP